MSRIVFLLEEHSMKIFLEEFLPRHFPGLKFLCIPHEGKKDLEQSIPRKLRAWREPGALFCILQDNDGADCLRLKERLKELCHHSGRQDAVVRIICQELEAWYFGAPEALAEVFRNETLRSLARKAKYRVPDAIERPSSVLRELVPNFQKISCAREMARRMTRNNTSKSFRVFFDAIEKFSQSAAKAM